MPAKTKKQKNGSSNIFTKFSNSSGKFKLLSFIVVFAVIGLATVLLSHAATGDGSVPIYRSFSPTAKAHLFTANGTEANGTQGLSYEGVAFYAWSNGLDGRVPVYRIFVNNSHLYTSSTAEKDIVLKGGGKLEGIAWYAYSGAAPARIPIYRLAAANGDHMYVASAGERDAISGPGKGYTYEGIAFYVSDHSVPLNYNAPSGVVDTATCKNIAGWAVDKDLPDNGVPINVYIDGKGYDLGFTSVPRGDVNAAARVAGNHGFNMAVPASWSDGQAHTWVAYALNIDSFKNVIGRNVELKRGEWACNSAGQDVMPQILAQRAEAERQRLAAIAAAEAKAEQDRKIIAYAVAVEQAKQNEAAAAAQSQQVAAAINAAASGVRNRQMAAVITIAAAEARNKQNAAQVLSSNVNNAAAQIVAQTITSSLNGPIGAINARSAIGANIGRAISR